MVLLVPAPCSRLVFVKVTVTGDWEVSITHEILSSFAGNSMANLMSAATKAMDEIPVRINKSEADQPLLLKMKVLVTVPSEMTRVSLFSGKDVIDMVAVDAAGAACCLFIGTCLNCLPPTQVSVNGL